MADSVEILEPAKSKKDYPVIRVRPDSPVPGIAAAIASSIMEDRCIVLRVIGAGALNQAVKGMIQASQQMALQGENLVFKPGFTVVEGSDGQDITAIILRCLLQ